MNIENNSISELINKPPVIEDIKIKCEVVYSMFTTENKCSYIVILDKNRPVGLITRTNFMLANSGAFGYSLHQKRPAINIANTDFLIVSETDLIPEIAASAMHRSSEHTYDPVVVVDAHGIYMGCIEIKSLLLRSSQLEIELAMNSNPLTGLPGNININQWLTNSLFHGEYHIMYGDLSNFKEYNDTYGFSNGDSVIKLAANAMKKHYKSISLSSNIGHIGGDDFIIVATGSINKRAVEQICIDFDNEIPNYFKPEHIKNGVYEAKNRSGHLQLVPITTLSISVINNLNFEYVPHIAELAKAAASLKKVAKQRTVETGKSTAVYERRIYTKDSPP